jgi:hypothetical protein
MILEFICAATIMVNKSNEDWTKRDRLSKKSAAKTCKEDYNDCLKVFIKKEPLTYNAICGGKKEKK